MPNPTNEERKSWLGLLARSPEGRADQLLTEAGLKAEFEWLRRPEIGSVMVRGRAGATGAPFNLGEMTVTRCSLRLEDGVVGHGYVQGRNKTSAEAAALIDALMQTAAADNVDAEILAPLRDEETTRNSARARKAAATKVDFFTMVRGED